MIYDNYIEIDMEKVEDRLLACFLFFGWLTPDQEERIRIKAIIDQMKERLEEMT